MLLSANNNKPSDYDWIQLKIIRKLVTMKIMYGTAIEIQ